MKLNQAQQKILANFCADAARGGLLSGLGFAFVIPGDWIARIAFTASSLLFAGLTLFLALQFAKMIKEGKNEYF